MKKPILTDIHTHTTFSTDGQDDIFSMLKKARSLGLSYWGISEHFDYDYFIDGVLFEGMPARYTDAERYFFTARKLQEQTKDIRILAGAEFGFTPDQRVVPYYRSVIERFSPDFIVNSVHTNGKFDYYEKPALSGVDKETGYGDYLKRVRESLDADYEYDIVAHLCYPCRWAPYEDRVLRLNEFSEQIDDILTTVIRKDKILEVNSSVKGLNTPFLPFPDIVKRYFELGGRKVSFASDAHGVSRLAENRERAVAELKQIGFTHITVPIRKRHILVDL